MAKAAKKNNRKMWKMIRKTLGTLFLISAIVVAAIPVDGLQAADGTMPLADRTAPSITTDSKGRIPQIDESTKIYTTGDRKYRFAYISDGGTDKIAVLLGYGALNLVDNTLEIPEAVDAYAKYTESLGTDKGYVAVGKNGNFLFYKRTETVWKEKKDQFGNTVSDGNGNAVLEEVEVVSYIPCYYDNIEEWRSISFDKLYYDSTDPDGTLHPGVDLNPENAVQTTDPKFQRIESATVAYISNQYLIQEDGEWVYHDEQYVTDATKDYGIFANNGNIKTLIVSENLLGIGDYAFYRCGYLESITLGNGLNTVGNGAFSDCVNMKSINLDIGSNLNQIGDHAFYNCQSLKDFTLPIQVSLIGDSAFEGCTSLKSIDLCSQGNFNQLTTLGRDIFKDCQALEYLVFPDKCTDAIYISSFMGCRSLKYISIRNNELTFVEEPGVYSYDDFKLMLEAAPVNGAFYFEGIENSALHKMCKENCFAFSYIDYYGGVCTNLDRYELTVQEVGGKATYEVNSSCHLMACHTEKGVTSITIPGRIGPYAVNYIDSTTFQDHCNVVKVVIPANILEIGSTAFRGCHNLKNVIFETGDVIIGEDAFKTQDNRSHEAECPDGGVVKSDADNLPAVKLQFTGPVSKTSTPFNYAMSEGGKYNVESQKSAYISYYSGWPENLEIQYNADTGYSELVDFPSFSDIAGQSKYVEGDKYSYITAEHEEAAKTAVSKYPHKLNEMTEYEMQIVNAALEVVIPEGVQSVKDGLFKSKGDADVVNYAYPRDVIAYSLKEISCKDDGTGKLTGTFTDCDLLNSITLINDVENIDDYAFDSCEQLEYVSIPSTLETMGLIPFRNCGMLTTVSFQDHPDYDCVDSIVFGPDSNGNSRARVIQYLLSRKTGVVNPSELAGVTELAKEAFRGTGVSNIDLKESSITNVPEYAFADTEKLSTVRLPYTCQSIRSYAFDKSELEYIEIPVETSVISPEAFYVAKDHDIVTFYCEDDSVAHEYAETYGFNTTSKPMERYYTVTFWDWDEEQNTNVVVKEEVVAAGHDANPPEPVGREGYKFLDWTFEYTGISKDTNLIARYEKIDTTETQLTVTFIDYDDTIYMTQKVSYGEDAIIPKDPSREGYVFTGWRPAITGITKDLETYAQYEKIDGTGDGTDNDGTGNDGNGTGGDGTGNGTGGDGTGNGGNGTGGNGSDGNGNGGNGTGTGSSNNGTSKLYTLTVINGSGSGSYVAGTQPVIVASDPKAGQEFSHWTIDPANVTIASKVLTATVITMPEENVTITAHYKAKTGSSVTTGSGNSSTSNSNRPNSNAGSLSSGGTTVVIDKNGLSNTGVVSATVNGSSDNFTIKISESSEASEAAVKALLAEYGDLNGIKYFPMDISLYDSTGKKEITDTTGLSISITLPLPDSMITYAGNNKVAGIVNNKLDKLSTKFTTISGVSCVIFTAEHFSPYVIYVDTENLTAGTITDSTPKTGDGIHPKWFLSIGLACISVVLFMKKDKKVLRKVTA